MIDYKNYKNEPKLTTAAVIKDCLGMVVCCSCFVFIIIAGFCF